MKPCRPANFNPRARLAPHRHAAAYAALVLDGSYVETSVDGRFSCTRGMMIVHPAWHAHANRFGHEGAVVLDLPVLATDGLRAVETADPEAICRLADRDPVQAGHAALEEARGCDALAPAPWLARMAALLASEDGTDIASIARACGVTAEHASRACKRWFGLGPAELRRERRLRCAMALLAAGARPADAATEAGFSDQPHLTRLLKRATGLTPARFGRC
ncbi:MAG: AraC family transcriptional regulator [Pseudomonadota bacterium]